VDSKMYQTSAVTTLTAPKILYSLSVIILISSAILTINNNIYIVRRSCLGIVSGKTSGYFLTSEDSGYLRFISSYVLTSNISGERSSGSQTSLTSFCWYIHFLSEFYFRTEFHFWFDVHSSTSPCS